MPVQIRLPPRRAPSDRVQAAAVAGFARAVHPLDIEYHQASRLEASRESFRAVRFRNATCAMSLGVDGAVRVGIERWHSSYR